MIHLYLNTFDSNKWLKQINILAVIIQNMLIVKYRVTLVDDFQRDPFTDSTRCLGRTNRILVVIDIKRHLATQNTRHEKT